GDRDRNQGDRPQGERRSFGDRPQGERRSFGDRDRGQSGERQSFRDRPRGGVDRPINEFAPVREHIPEPPLPDDITARDLPASARNELKTLSKENAEQTARHLAMAAQLIDDEPERA